MGGMVEVRISSPEVEFLISSKCQEIAKLGRLGQLTSRLTSPKSM